MRKYFVWGLLAIFFMVLVLAQPGWQGDDVWYNATEDTPYSHDFSVNVTNPEVPMTYTIYSINDYDSESYDLDTLYSWIDLDSSSGLMWINATTDSESGEFNISVTVVNSIDEGSTASFEFNVTAVNDAPNFTELVDGGTYSWVEDEDNLIIVYNASDEEGADSGIGYPLNFSAEVFACDYAEASTRTDDVDCGDFLNWTQYDEDSLELNLTRSNDFVGVYNVTFKVNDSNSETEINVTFQINNSNDAPYFTWYCNDSLDNVEDDSIYCFVNASDVDEANNLTFEINSDLNYFLFNNSLTTYTYDCSGGQCDAFANVSFLTNDSYVGNWSVNISVTDSDVINPQTGWANFSFFVNNTEDLVYSGGLDDFTSYENMTRTLLAYDEDLLIDSTYFPDKVEQLTFTSNNSDLFYFGDSSASITRASYLGYNYSNVTGYVNFDYARDNSIESASIAVKINDTAGNVNWTNFTITFSSNSPPTWNSPVVDYGITEDDAAWGGINLSEYITDGDDDPITFYYINYTSFCSLNSTNFNSSGIVNFTASDCDVGYHIVNITAGDGKMNSTQKFNFTIYNVEDAPSITQLDGNGNTNLAELSNVEIAEDTEINFTLTVADDDFWIPAPQIAYYNESLVIDVNVTNETGDTFDFFENFSFSEWDGGSRSNISLYFTNFTPTETDIGNYTVVINVTDNSSQSDTFTFYLNVTSVSEPPILDEISNQTLTIHDSLSFTASASDDEDDLSGTSLNYYIQNITPGAPDVSIEQTTGEVGFDFASDEDYAGIWEYNVSVNDSDSLEDWQSVYVTVYGTPSFLSPTAGDVYNLSENDSPYTDLSLEVNHSVGDNMTYEIWTDFISCENSSTSSCSYSDMILRNTTWDLGNGTAFTFPFSSNFSDETYGLYKNLTVVAYPNNTGLSAAQKASVKTNRTFKLMINHTNAPIVFSGEISNRSGVSTSGFSLDLSSYFSDVDANDGYYNDSINFSFYSGSSPSYVKVDSVALPTNVTLDSWTVAISRAEEGEETLWITAGDFNETNETISSATSNNFTVSFVAPETQTVTEYQTVSGGSSTKIKHYSLKIITPQNVVIDEDENYIEVPFSVENTGQVDLQGISLSSYVQFNNTFSSDISINLEEGYIDTLKYGQVENFTMRISANTQRSGTYKATIYANVTKPKFSDWGDFVIELRKTNETNAEQLLVFTEKFISENPECLELRELVSDAQEAFNNEDFSESLRITREVVQACEEAIGKNEQVKFGVLSVSRGFYNVSLLTLSVFMLGLVFYVYRRVRFNKSRVDNYI